MRNSSANLRLIFIFTPTTILLLTLVAGGQPAADVETLLDTAGAYYDAGDYGKAAQTYELVLETDPSNAAGALGYTYALSALDERRALDFLVIVVEKVPVAHIGTGRRANDEVVAPRVAEPADDLQLDGRLLRREQHDLRHLDASVQRLPHGVDPLHVAMFRLRLSASRRRIGRRVGTLAPEHPAVSP